jgi:hypothetical protein
MVFGNPHDIACFRAICFSPNPEHPREERLDFEKIMPSPATVLALETLPGREWRNAELLLQRIGIDVSNETVSPRFSRVRQLRSMTNEDIRSMLELGKRDDLDPFCIGNARLLLQCIGATGCYSPRHWAETNWGTRCNTLYTEILDLWSQEVEVRFDTAWNAPLPIFRKLGRMFPNLEFRINSLDPDMDWALRGFVKGSYSEFWDADFACVYECVFGEPMPEKGDEEDEDRDEEVE